MLDWLLPTGPIVPTSVPPEIEKFLPMEGGANKLLVFSTSLPPSVPVLNKVKSEPTGVPLKSPAKLMSPANCPVVFHMKFPKF